MWSLHFPQIQSPACLVSQEATIYGLHHLGLWLPAGFGRWEAQLGKQKAGRVGVIRGMGRSGYRRLFQGSTVFQ